ncbi:MAG: hypothetical protein V4615_10115, partial [Bacteroidota bacterium]
ILLLFSEYLLRKHNHHVVYLGASLPFGELNNVVKTAKPDYLLTYLTVPMSKVSVLSYLKKLASTFPKCKILAGGVQLEHIKSSLPANCVRVNSVEEFLAVIA